MPVTVDVEIISIKTILMNYASLFTSLNVESITLWGCGYVINVEVQGVQK